MRKNKNKYQNWSFFLMRIKLLKYNLISKNSILRSGLSTKQIKYCWSRKIYGRDTMKPSPYWTSRILTQPFSNNTDLSWTKTGKNRHQMISKERPRVVKWWNVFRRVIWLRKKWTTKSSLKINREKEKKKSTIWKIKGFLTLKVQSHPNYPNKRNNKIRNRPTLNTTTIIS
jgi:hypothetical protein